MLPLGEQMRVERKADIEGSEHQAIRADLGGPLLAAAPHKPGNAALAPSFWVCPDTQNPFILEAGKKRNGTTGMVDGPDS